MEALAWNFFVSALLSLLTKHSCQVPADHDTRTLNPIILLQPAPSGISYEALQYPVPMDQYQLVPLVINTGKIPLINHVVQAPIQYFVPGGENRRVAGDDPARRSTATTTASARRDGRYRSTAAAAAAQQQRSGRKPVYSDAARTENRPAREYGPTTTVYSGTRVESRPAASSRYSYGYKIIDGRRRESRGGGGMAAPGENDRAVARSGDGPSRAEVRGGPQDPADEPAGRDGGSSASRASSRPIVVEPDPETTRTELRKRYKTAKNGTKLETPINAANENGILTTLKP